jgi:hypothetical protein
MNQQSQEFNEQRTMLNLHTSMIRSIVDCNCSSDERIKWTDESHVLPTKNSSKLLPETFAPSPNTVLIGRSKESKRAEGNTRLRHLATSFLHKYSKAPTKSDKTEIVSQIVDIIKSKCTVGAFVKRAEKEGRWREVSVAVAREKVGYVMRDLLHDKYRSSSASKAAKRRLEIEQKQMQPTGLISWGEMNDDEVLFQKLQLFCGEPPFTSIFRGNEAGTASSMIELLEPTPIKQQSKDNTGLYTSGYTTNRDWYAEYAEIISTIPSSNEKAPC